MKIMCAGPTSISESVMKKMGVSQRNPDLDPEYKEFHRRSEQKFSKLIHTEERTFYILAEAMLGLEASVCNLTEPGDNVLVISNGFFGEGFVEFVKYYGANPHLLSFDPRRGIDTKKLEEFLNNNDNFKYATMVHCETPTGITNNLKEISKVLNDHGIMVVVDSVSGIGGEEFYFDDWNIDIAICGSQKCISAPVGLTTITVSKRAMDVINKRESIPSYYMNFKNYLDFPNDDFPYTMNENIVYAFDAALDELMEKDSLNLHKKYAKNTREIFEKAGFELFAKDSFSNTLSCIVTPDGIKSEDILSIMREKGMAISKGLGNLEEKVFRIGHMGNNINREDFLQMYKKLDETFAQLKIRTNISLAEEFEKSNI